MAALVTPSNSNEDYDQYIWIHRLEGGEGLTQTDWEKFAETPAQEAHNQDPSVMKRWIGMVQDMLEPEYVGVNADEETTSLGNSNLTERIPLVLSRRVFLEEPTAAHKKIRRNEPTDVKAYFYYEQYPEDHHHHQQRLRLNQLVEVVAVVSVPTEQDGTDESTDDDENLVMSTEQRTIREMFPVFEQDAEERRAVDKNKHLPRWHVVWFRPVHLLQHAHRLVSTPPSPSSLHYNALSCWLHSHAQRRQDGSPIITPDGRCLGCVSLEWILPDNDDISDSFASIVTRLQPACPVVQVVSLDTLLHDEDDDDGGACLIPERKNTSPYLQSTLLQLPPGSIVVIDARNKNIADHPPAGRAILQGLCRTHRLDYRFGGGVTIPMEADYRILVVSNQQTRRQIPCTMTIQGSVGDDDDDNAWTWEPCTVVGNIAIPPSLLENVPLPETATALDRCLLLARLQAARRDANVVDPSDWQAAVELDRAVREVESQVL